MAIEQLIFLVFIIFLPFVFREGVSPRPETGGAWRRHPSSLASRLTVPDTNSHSIFMGQRSVLEHSKRMDNRDNAMHKRDKSPRSVTMGIEEP
jgi:hypothetical protein